MIFDSKKDLDLICLDSEDEAVMKSQSKSVESKKEAEKKKAEQKIYPDLKELEVSLKEELSQTSKGKNENNVKRNVGTRQAEDF